MERIYMPTSPWSNLPKIIGIIMDLRPYPSRVLDVGIGYGKYGLLCREYISYWNSSKEPREVIVDGVEAFEEYIGELQRNIYDNIFIGDALEVLPLMPDNSYDLILLIDVLEHFEREAGIRVIAECRRVGKAVLVSTPRKFFLQEDSWGNPYERHKSLWSKKDLLALGASQVVQAENWVAMFAKASYASRFSIAYRTWRLGTRWIPAWLNPYARWFFRRVSRRSSM
jgi:SAM-dependent methyltransferase